MTGRFSLLNAFALTEIIWHDALTPSLMFLWAVGRPPTESQLQIALNLIQRNAGKRRQAYEDILWSLLNSSEFRLNH